MPNSSKRVDQMLFQHPTTLAIPNSGINFSAPWAPMVPTIRDIITSLTGVEPEFTETHEAYIWVWTPTELEAISLLFYVSTSMQGQAQVGFTKTGTQTQKIVRALMDNDSKIIFEKGCDIELFVAAFTAIFDTKDARVPVADGIMYCWMEQSVFVSYWTAGTKSGRIEISFSSSSPVRSAILALGSAHRGRLEPQPVDSTRRRSAPRKRAYTDDDL